MFAGLETIINQSIPDTLIILFVLRTYLQLQQFDGLYLHLRVIVMVFNATFNNILVISSLSVLLVKETEVHGENQRLTASNVDACSPDTRRGHTM